MKYTIKLLFLLFLLALLFLPIITQAQSVPIKGQTILINGQTFLLTETNGIYTATSTGPNGTVSVSTPTSEADAIASIQGIIGMNNPTNADYYSTNEIEMRLGSVYEQDSGQAGALISITKWGSFPIPNVGYEAGLIQGNQNGTSGTAAGYGAVDYRKIIGDVAFVGGLGGGYDNYNATPFGLIKGGVEYRQNKHLGEWVDLNYSIESKGNASRGFGFAAGVTGIF